MSKVNITLHRFELPTCAGQNKGQIFPEFTQKGTSKVA